MTTNALAAAFCPLWLFTSTTVCAQPHTTPEIEYLRPILAQLRTAEDLPIATRIVVARRQGSYLNASAQPRSLGGDDSLFIDTTLIRFLWNDPEAVGFVLAHEYGHLISSNCSASTKRLLAHAIAGAIAGGVANGGTGAAKGAQLAQQRICEENADIAAVHFMREAGMDPSAGLRWLQKMAPYGAREARSATAYFMSTHPVGPERIARLSMAIANQTIPDLIP